MKIKRGIGRMLAFALLALCMAGTSRLELIHSLVHDHDLAVTHSEEQEKDPCHRSIYHGDTEQGCEHNSHLIVSDQCQLCDLLCYGNPSMLSDINHELVKFSSEHFGFYKLNLDSYRAVISSSRAPPNLV